MKPPLVSAPVVAGFLLFAPHALIAIVGSLVVDLASRVRSAVIVVPTVVTTVAVSIPVVVTVAVAPSRLISAAAVAVTVTVAVVTVVPAASR